jgi:hypothetical protein
MGDFMLSSQRHSVPGKGLAYLFGSLLLNLFGPSVYRQFTKGGYRLDIATGQYSRFDSVYAAASPSRALDQYCPANQFLNDD